MNIDKDTIVNFLKEQGQHDKAQQAQQQLPDQVDHEQQSNLLQQYGIDPQKLLGKVKGLL
ncbi:MAG TPA: hypothetical protein VFC33_03960 [Acidimicrobiia bacterium]|nr:hypothetical protein [Acidimicrobiia bacterium]